MTRGRAVFLDRDGVINENVYYVDSQEWESPRTRADLRLLPRVIDALRRLRDAGYALVVVSNQPSYAKGKTSLDDLKAVHEQLLAALNKESIRFDGAFYCFHHPQGIVPGYSGTCECRKPSPYFLKRAAAELGLDLRASWMIGDRSTDIKCGRAAGTRTIRIRSGPPSETLDAALPDHWASDLSAAVKIILE